MLKSSGSLAEKNILVVEDEWLIANDLKRALTNDGAHVVGPVSSVGQALTLLNRNCPIDAALLDIHLGSRLNVYPLAVALQRLGIPFIFATGYDNTGIRSDFAAIPCLVKPFEPKSVGSVLAAAIKAHQWTIIRRARKGRRLATVNRVHTRPTLTT